jgi:hypothetical protein
VPDGAQLVAGRTGLGVGQGLGLLGQQGGAGALAPPLGGGVGGLLQGEQVSVHGGAGLAGGAWRNDFAPLGREVTEVLEFRGA